MPPAPLGFIGAGNMAEAIAHRVLRAALYRPDQLLAADLLPQRRELFRLELDVSCSESAAEVAAAAAVLILAVKPQMYEAALDQVRPVLRRDTLVISIAPGITTRYVENALGGPDGRVRVIRVMPNTPILVGMGMSGLASGKWATEEDLTTAERIFDAGGRTIRAREDLMDAITGVSGSGPAYVFYLVEALAAAGMKLGLPEVEANLLARQTVIGAGLLLEQSKDSPAVLRRKVANPGGTTQAALDTFAAGDFFGLVAKAVEAAERRGKELSR